MRDLRRARSPSSPVGRAASAGRWASGSAARACRSCWPTSRRRCSTQTVDELRGRRPRRHRRRHRRRRLRVRRALRDATLDAYGAVHVAVQQRRRRRRRRGPAVGPHAERLALGDRRERVGRHPRHQGVRPGDARARRRGPRRQHVVGQRRHRAAARARRSTRRRRPAVVTITECLYAQLQAIGARDRRVGAVSPVRTMLRTGLFSSWRNRPDELANANAPHDATDHDRVVREADGRCRRRPSTTRRSRRWPDRVVDAIARRPVLDPARRASAPTSRSTPGPRRCWPARTPTTSAT